MTKTIVFSLLASVLGALVLVQNINLTRANHDLRLRIGTLTGDELVVGRRVSALVGVNLDGQRTVLMVADQQEATLVLTMSSGCPACRSSLEAWNRLGRAAAAKGAKTVVVSRDWMDTLREFVADRNELPGDLIADPTFATYVGLRLAVVPHALLIQPDGVVSHVWVGAIDSDAEAEIARVLGAL